MSDIDSEPKLTNKQRVFIEEYLMLWNASEAARRAGYATPGVEGSRLLKNDNVSRAIQARLAELKMSADEVLTRLADHARGSMENFIDPDTLAIDFKRAKEAKKLHLIKKFKCTTIINAEKDTQMDTIEFELYDAQSALVQLGKHHKLFTDKQEISGPDGGAIEIKATDYRAAIANLAPRPMGDSDTPGKD